MKALTIARSYVAGVLHGDGWCTAMSLGLRVKDKDFATAFATALNGVMGTAIGVLRDERGYWTVRGSNATGRFTHLRGYAPHEAEEKAAWLRGLFDSEGNAQCIKLARGEASFARRIAFYSTERATLEKASTYLTAFGMAHVIRPTKNSATHKGTKVVFELILQRREAFQQFAKVVGSSIERKRIVLDAIASTFQPPGWQARNWAKAIAARYAHLTAATCVETIA